MPRLQPLIQVSRLSKTYRKGSQVVHALRHVDLEVMPGDLMAVMGPSGSGKSTLMHILGCMDRPSSGHYRLNGDEVSRMDDDSLSQVRNRRIGFVFQSFNLLPRMNALENVMLPLHYGGGSGRREAALGALARVGLASRTGHLPSELSGGQQQRVAIARALVTRPSLLVADEPTGNLDSHSSREILKLLHSLNDEGNTIVLVTHDPGLAGRCRRVLTLKDGRISKDRRRSKRRVL